MSVVHAVPNRRDGFLALPDISKRLRRSNKPESVDFSSRPVPAWVQEVIEAHLAIEAEDAKSAKQLGFMARALVLATMPYKDPKADVFKRINGNFSSVVSG